MRAVRVVVVDDHEAIRTVLRELLRDAGHVVVAEAEDGRAGVRTAERHRPDLVIMDWSMPLMDGIAATREIRSRRPAIAVIAFSSAHDPGVRAAFLQAGAAAYVEKPDIDALLAAVGQTADASRGSAPTERGRPSTSAVAEPFAISARSWPALGQTHLALRGPLTGDAGDELLTAVDDHSRPGAVLVLDLSQLTAVDDRGSAALAQCSARAAANQSGLEIRDPSPAVRHALRRPQTR